MAPHSSISAWKIPWMEEPGRLQSMGSLESDTTEQPHFHFSLSCIGEGNGNPLQCSCLENPRDGEAWRVAVSGVAQSRTQLKWLSSSSSSSSMFLWMKNYIFQNRKIHEEWHYLLTTWAAKHSTALIMTFENLFKTQVFLLFFQGEKVSHGKKKTN